MMKSTRCLPDTPAPSRRLHLTLLWGMLSVLAPLAAAGCTEPEGACACASRCFDGRYRCPTETERLAGLTCQEADYSVDCGRYWALPDAGCEGAPACTVAEGSEDAAVADAAVTDAAAADQCLPDGGGTDAALQDGGVPGAAACADAGG